MEKAIHFVTKGVVTYEATKMAIDYVEHGIVCLDKMLKSVKLEELAIDKELKVNNEFYDQKKYELHYELIQHSLLDPHCIMLKGLTNARIKSHLKK